MVRLSPSEGLPATWEMELRNCRLASTGSTTVVVTIPSSGLPERTARCWWQRSSNCSGVSLRCVSRHFSAASLASRGPAPLTASSNADTSAPSGGLVTASNSDSAEAALISPLLTASFSSGEAANASPNRTREAASPYEVLVRPASQSAMLRAPLPSHTRWRSASATTTACKARTRSRCCCNPNAPAANDSRDSECTLTIATAVAPSSRSSRDASTLPVLSNTSSFHNLGSRFVSTLSRRWQHRASSARLAAQASTRRAAICTKRGRVEMLFGVCAKSESSFTNAATSWSSASWCVRTGPAMASIVSA
ncbi:unannotated protein [freshwater metagenome]|uniref:Unannotated protein n=1 Tax=freshwater metagenome TaxID=449393 RepID=A0A6J7KBE2_9ZZZZ